MRTTGSVHSSFSRRSRPVWGTNRFAEVRETGESEDGVILRGDMGFQHQLTDTTKIVDRFLVESNSDNTYMQNDLGLEVTIFGSLGLRVGYQVRHKHRCTPGRGEDRYSHHRRIDLRNQVSSPP